MRVNSVVLFVFALALVIATTATAQTICVPSSGTAVQTPTGDETIVAVVTPSVPAGFGAGPVNQVATLPEGQTFDSRYIQLAYQQHADIASLAEFGAQRATDPNLRGLSQKMVNERVDLNRRLTNNWGPYECLGCLAADNTRVNEITQSLVNLCGCDFDRAYAAAMTVMLQQENRLANEGTFKSEGGLQDYSNRAKRTSYNEARWFENWTSEGSETCPAPCPPVGAGPICPEPCPAPQATPCPTPCPAPQTAPAPCPTPCP